MTTTGFRKWPQIADHFVFQSPNGYTWPHFTHKGTRGSSGGIFLYHHEISKHFWRNWLCNVFHFGLYFFPLSPVLPTDRKSSLLHRLCRERAGVKSVWFALMRPQVVIMEFSPVVAARSSSKEQSKVHNSASVGRLWWICVTSTLSNTEDICSCRFERKQFQIEGLCYS